MQAVDQTTIQCLTIWGVLLTKTCYYPKHATVVRSTACDFTVFNLQFFTYPSKHLCHSDAYPQLLLNEAKERDHKIQVFFPVVRRGFTQYARTI